MPKLTPRAIPSSVPMVCQVDPAIASVTLTKGSRPRQVSVAYEIVNRGRSRWQSPANAQNVVLDLLNLNTRRSYHNMQPLPGDIPAGGRMIRFVTPMIDDALDDLEFAGTLDLRINYSPDMLNDGNLCNDDFSAANNHLRIDNATLIRFMRSKARTQTFRP
jgi:hypothetical protein